jgi:cell wall-associated NlpC family hydrolase
MLVGLTAIGVARLEELGRAAIVREALEFIGTPYHDHGEVKGKGGGVDCATLIKLVYRNAGIVDDFTIDYYSPQHFLHSERELYLEYILRFAHEISPEQAKPGDVVMYKLGRSFGHGAIIIDPGWPHIVHAWGPARLVCRGDGLQEGLGNRWRERKFFSHFSACAR